jgi:hypothetical protein
VHFRHIVDSLCPFPHLFSRVRITCLACCSVATDGRASVSCHHDVSSPPCIHVSASFRYPSLSLSGPSVLGLRPQSPRATLRWLLSLQVQTSMSSPFTSRCACLVDPSVPITVVFIISDSSRFSESDGCGVSSTPLPHRPVSIPSLSQSASPLRKPSKSALSARTRFLGHSHGALPDVPGSVNHLSSRHSHFVGSQTAFRSMRSSA